MIQRVYPNINMTLNGTKKYIINKEYIIIVFFIEI